MKTGITLSGHDIGRKISKLLYRFHFVIFVVIVVGSMAVAIFMLNQTINRAVDTSQMVHPIPERFDQETIDRLNELDTDGTQRDIDLPDGRINPFNE